MDVIDIKKLKKLVKFMKSEGVLSLKQANFDIQLAPVAIFHEKQPPPAPPAPEAPTQPGVGEGRFTDEDIAMWSSAGIPQ